MYLIAHSTPHVRSDAYLRISSLWKARWLEALLLIRKKVAPDMLYVERGVDELAPHLLAKRGRDL